jgi:CheY-like chemotaxis protein
MAKLRVLIVDDHARWREILREDFAHVEPGGEADVACLSTERDALIELDARAYDLAVVDLSLLGVPEDPAAADERGFELLKAIRSSPLQRRCAILVVTAYPTSDRVHRALLDFGVRRVLYKDEYDSEDRTVLRIAREAILEARLRGTGIARRSRYSLTLSFDDKGWTHGELRGPNFGGRDGVRGSARFDAANLSRRADDINLRLLAAARTGDWRREMADLGNIIFQTIAGEPRLYDKWATARVLAQGRTDLWARFRGPASGLGIPFDLTREGTEYSCLQQILTREIDRPGLAQPPRPFFRFLKETARPGRPLRILLVAANTDGNIPGVEREVETLVEQIGKDLSRIGVDHRITALQSAEATYRRVKEELRDGRYHLFHYAGHGRYEDDVPQASGLVLAHGDGFRALTANDLSIVAESGLQLVYLSCCLGAVNKSAPSTDDFCGIYDALASAGVPTVLGFRWVVPDDATADFAVSFYSHLWRTLCPGEAALEARREAVTGQWGRDDHTWAAPVLLMQGP